MTTIMTPNMAGERATATNGPAQLRLESRRADTEKGHHYECVEVSRRLHRSPRPGAAGPCSPCTSPRPPRRPSRPTGLTMTLICRRTFNGSPGNGLVGQFCPQLHFASCPRGGEGYGLTEFVSTSARLHRQQNGVNPSAPIASAGVQAFRDRRGAPLRPGAQCHLSTREGDWKRRPESQAGAPFAGQRSWRRHRVDLGGTRRGH